MLVEINGDRRKKKLKMLVQVKIPFRRNQAERVAKRERIEMSSLKFSPFLVRNRRTGRCEFVRLFYDSYRFN